MTTDESVLSLDQTSRVKNTTLVKKAALARYEGLVCGGDRRDKEWSEGREGTNLVVGYKRSARDTEKSPDKSNPERNTMDVKLEARGKRMKRVWMWVYNARRQRGKREGKEREKEQWVNGNVGWEGEKRYENAMQASFI